MEINLKKEIQENTWKNFLIIESLAGELFDEIYKQPDFNPESIDVKILINNKEADFDRFVNCLENQFNELIESHARSLVQEKLDELDDYLESLKNVTDPLVKQYKQSWD